MPLSFGDKLRNLARISLIHGLGLAQTPRSVHILSSLDPSAREYLQIVVREAYEIGVPYVDVTYVDPTLNRLQFKYAPADMRAHVPQYVGHRAQEIIDTNGRRLRIDGNVALGAYSDVDKSIPPARDANEAKLIRPFTTLVMGMKIPWHVCAAATEVWAKALQISVDELWEHIFACTGADRPDALEYADDQLKKLSLRRDILNALKIKSLRFEGPGTDLTVGLSPLARWVGGKRQSADGTWFAPNWPTAESFTTPDWRTVNGVVCATKDLAIDGTIVRGLSLRFENGEVVEVTASHGLEAFQNLVRVDAGASRAGEIAVVDIESPIARRNMVFLQILFDENAADHLAIGRAYTAALAGGTEMTPEQRTEHGCNDSAVHRDIMISDSRTNLTATTWDGDEIVLQRWGRFLGELAQTA